MIAEFNGGFYQAHLLVIGKALQDQLPVLNFTLDIFVDGPVDGYFAVDPFKISPAVLVRKGERYFEGDEIFLVIVLSVQAGLECGFLLGL